jgi:putative acetyltransferase
LSNSWITRAETAADVDIIRELTRQAFGRDFEADLVDALRADPVAWLLPELSIVTTTPAGEIVGHALFTRVHIDETPALSLGPVSVVPAYQNQGVGSAAIRAGLAVATERGEHAIVLVGHLEYYPRFGFGPAAKAGISATFETGPHLMALGLDPRRPLPAGVIRYPVDLQI